MKSLRKTSLRKTPSANNITVETPCQSGADLVEVNDAVVVSLAPERMQFLAA